MSATTPLRIGIVLTGGGAKGAYQIGCLRALRDAGLLPLDAISGASVGAIHGVMLAAGKLDEAEAIWRRARWRDVAAMATRRLPWFPVWLLAGLVSEFSPFSVWRLSELVTHPVRWRRHVYPSACLATALGLWAARHLVHGGGVVEGFAILLAACASLAIGHEWLRPHFLGSSPLSHEPLIATLELFAASRAMMWPSTSYEYWGRLPDQLDVFRVGSGTFEEVLGGFSWYLRRDFAELFVDPSENRIVLRGEISRDDLIFVSTAHTEVVFRRPPRRASHFNLVQII